MTSNDRKDIYNQAINNGYRTSSDGSKLINNNGNTIKFVGSNRTMFDNNTVYGAHNAKNKLG